MKQKEYEQWNDPVFQENAKTKVYALEDSLGIWSAWYLQWT